MLGEELQPVQAAEHELSIEGRRRMRVSGVQDVTGFDENLVILSTSAGELTVRGQELHIEKIDLETGRLELQGRIGELSYDDTAPSGSLWSRLFG